MSEDASVEASDSVYDQADKYDGKRAIGRTKPTCG